MIEQVKLSGNRSYFSGCALIIYGRDRYYGIFSGVEYARLTTKRRDKEFARELEKILAELIKRLKQEWFFL